MVDVLSQRWVFRRWCFLLSTATRFRPFVDWSLDEPAHLLCAGA